MNKINSNHPWRVTFSYARAIQQSALNIWSGKDSNVEDAQKNYLSEQCCVQKLR